jgi:hypothetical protein
VPNSITNPRPSTTFAQRPKDEPDEADSVIASYVYSAYPHVSIRLVSYVSQKPAMIVSSVASYNDNCNNGATAVDGNDTADSVLPITEGTC